MASAWGSSWGNAWGNSWGSIAAVGIEIGGRIVGGTFTRGQWRKLKKEREEQWRLACEAQERAEQRALELKNANSQAKAYAATQLANEVISQAIQRDIDLARLTRALNGAADAAKAGETLKAAAHVKRVAQEIIKRIKEEDDDE